MPSLALRNLFHDRIRLGVTLVGVQFAVVLIAIQLGLFIGFSRATTNLIDHSGADLWITSEGVRYVEAPVPFSERKLNTVRGTPGVAWAEKHTIMFSRWKRPDGAEEGVQVVGFNLYNPALPGGPYNLVEGSVEDLKQDAAVIIDRLYMKKLGVTRLGQAVEINKRRARVVGFTQGIRTFTTAPAVFTTFANALDYTSLNADQTAYILVKAAPGVDPRALQAELRRRLADVDVHTTPEFSRITRNYWLFGTGAGVTVLIAAALGLIVGVVIVAQTLYATTVDHLREFGTLKAIGASNGYLYRVIVKQAVTAAAIGYTVGIGVAFIAIAKSATGNAAIVLPWPVAAALFGLTLMMCVGASLVSIHKATTIDPAMVFKG
jgi:putative ABC transport system permease protein